MRKREESKKYNTKINSGINAGSGMYQASVMKRVVDRAGHCKNLKGHVNEILTVDKINLSPKNILSGRHASLTKSAIAKRDDIVIKKAGKVVGRMQLKDTPSSIDSTIKRVMNHQYKGTKLVGTIETVDAYNKVIAKNGQKKVSQKMVSNNISSTETDVLARLVLGTGLKGSGKGIAKISNRSACVGAAINGGVCAVTSAIDVKNGKKTWQEGVVDTAKGAAKSYVSVGAGQAADLGITILVASTPLAPAAKAIGTVGGMGVSYGVEKTLDACEKMIKNDFLGKEETEYEDRR